MSERCFLNWSGSDWFYGFTGVFCFQPATADSLHQWHKLIAIHWFRLDSSWNYTVTLDYSVLYFCILYSCEMFNYGCTGCHGDLNISSINPRLSQTMGSHIHKCIHLTFCIHGGLYSDLLSWGYILTDMILHFSTSDFQAGISALHCIPNWSKHHVSFLPCSPTTTIPHLDALYYVHRSEERRVGKECA